MMPAYKDKQRGTWYVALYYKDWTGETKHTVKRGFKTKGDATAFERQFLDTLQNSSNIGFGALVANYLEYLKPRVKPTTIGTKLYIINDKILPYFEKMKLCDIDTVTIIKWQNTLLDYRDEDGKPYKPTYVKTIHAQLSSIMNYAVKHYHLAQNPCQLVGTIGAQKAKEMSFWTKDEFDKFIEVVKHPAYHLFFNLLFYTGMRSGEALALTAADILPDKKISISKTFATIDKKDVFLSTKTEGSTRVITIPESLYQEIQDYTGQLFGYEPEDRIFYFTKHAANAMIHRCAKKAGVKEIRVHDLRHSHTALLINMGFDIKQISQRLGHRSVKTTWDVYSHLYPEKDVELADKLNEISQKSPENEIEKSADE